MRMDGVSLWRHGDTFTCRSECCEFESRHVHVPFVHEIPKIVDGAKEIVLCATLTVDGVLIFADKDGVIW
uniref:Uncharacterized protein n=1 Tax=Arion vulgaris TaxID=1028688 RepID=A0A0B7ADX5_9EUPU